MAETARVSHNEPGDCKAIRADQWLLGRVHCCTPFGVYADVWAPGCAERMRGLVYVTEMDQYPAEPESLYSPGDEVQVRIIDVDAPDEGTLLLSMRTSPLDLRDDLLAREQDSKEVQGPAEVVLGLRVYNPVYQRKGHVVHLPWGQPPIFLVQLEDGFVHSRLLDRFRTEDDRKLQLQGHPLSVRGQGGVCSGCKRKGPLDPKAWDKRRYCYLCWRNTIFE
mmetsp:Transcript_138475/g.386269  ORF Transcript_138475/g.386269 Transcript_138475/m.386269 type:complete len:221 (-) Transcript_138475:27-689(-)